MTVACHLVATAKSAEQLVAFVESLQRDLRFMGYKTGREPEIERREHDYLVVVGSIVRKDSMT